MVFVAVHWSRSGRFHVFGSVGINKVCGGPRIRTVTAITPENRDTPFCHQSLRAPGQVSRNVDDERRPTPVIIRRRCATECRADCVAQFGKPGFEASPVTTKRVAPTLHVLTIKQSKKICLDGLISNDPIRLREPRQQTYGEKAQPAPEATHGDSQRFLIQPGEPALVIPQRTHCVPAAMRT